VDSICCPYGARIAAPIVCTLIGLILFYVTAFSCATFKISSDYYYYYEDEYYYSDEELEWGFWGYYYWDYDESYCDDYGSDTDFDAPFKFGRAISVLGAIFGGTILILLLIASCVRYPGPKIFFRILGSCMLLMAAFSLLLLVGLATENLPNEMGGTAYAVIPSALFWIAAGLTTMFTMQERDSPIVVSAAAIHAEPTPAYSTKQQGAPPLPPATTKEIEKRINEDGSMTVITTTRLANPDGTITEEITEKTFPAGSFDQLGE